MCGSTEAACMDDLSINQLPHRCCSPCIVQRIPGSLFLSVYTTARDCSLFPPQDREESTDSLQHGVSTCRNRHVTCAQDPKAVGETVAKGLTGSVRP